MRPDQPLVTVDKYGGIYLWQITVSPNTTASRKLSTAVVKVFASPGRSPVENFYGSRCGVEKRRGGGSNRQEVQVQEDGRGGRRSVARSIRSAHMSRRQGCSGCLLGTPSHPCDSCLLGVHVSRSGCAGHCSTGGHGRHGRDDEERTATGRQKERPTWGKARRTRTSRWQMRLATGNARQTRRWSGWSR